MHAACWLHENLADSSKYARSPCLTLAVERDCFLSLLLSIATAIISIWIGLYRRQPFLSELVVNATGIATTRAAGDTGSLDDLGV